MDISQLKILNMMQSNLKYLNERQDVISENIANANVPGYRAKDLKAPDFAKLVSDMNVNSAHVTLAATEAGHITPSNNSNFETVIRPVKEGEVTPTGNSVVLEDEVSKMSTTGLEYQQTTELYRKMLELIKTALGTT